MKSQEFTDYYKLLDVAPTATIDDIRKAYIQKAKEHHPDTGGSTESMQRYNLAYKTLTGNSTKAAYDMLHSFHVGSTKQGDYRYGDDREVSSSSDMEDAEIDSFLDSLLNEYSQGQSKEKLGVRSWFKKHLNL